MRSAKMKVPIKLKVPYSERYSAEVKASILRARRVMSKSETLDYINSIDKDSFTIDVGATNHQMLICKEQGVFYFYDPNLGISRCGKSLRMSDVETIFSYCDVYRVKDLSTTDSSTKLTGKACLDLCITDYVPKGGEPPRNLDSSRMIQNQLIEEVNTYIREHYHVKKFDAKGLCYGLSTALKEVVLSTGSIASADRYMKKLITAIKKSRGKVVPPIIKTLMMVYMFQDSQGSQYGFSLDPNTEKSERHKYHHSARGRSQDMYMTLPLSLRVGGVSSPNIAYKYLKGLSKDEYAKLMDNITRDDLLLGEGAFQSLNKLSPISCCFIDPTISDEVLIEKNLALDAEGADTLKAYKPNLICKDSSKAKAGIRKYGPGYLLLIDKDTIEKIKEEVRKLGDEYLLEKYKPFDWKQVLLSEPRGNLAFIKPKFDTMLSILGRLEKDEAPQFLAHFEFEENELNKLIKSYPRASYYLSNESVNKLPTLTRIFVKILRLFRALLTKIKEMFASKTQPLVLDTTKSGIQSSCSESLSSRSEIVSEPSVKSRNEERISNPSKPKP